MKSIKLIALFLLSAVSFTYSQTADEIVNNNIKAMGGKDKIAAMKTVKMTGNLDIGPDMKAPFTIFLKDGKKMRFEMEIQGMKMIQAFDGDSGWYIQPFSGKTDPERMSPEEVKVSKDQADFTGPLFDYKTKGNTIEYIGKEDMEGTDTYKLKVTKKTGDISYIYIDATTNLQLKETTKQKFKDKETEAASLSSNYKSVDGVMFPFAMEQRGSDDASQGQALNLDKVELNVPMDDSIFKMPVAAAAGTDGKK